MNQFEFLPLVTIGQYVPNGSIVHRVDARTKLIVFAALLVAITFTPSLVGLLVALMALLIGILAARISLKVMLKGLLVPLPFLVLIVLLQLLFFNPQVESATLFSWWIIRLTQAGLNSAIIMLLRFIDLIFCLSLSSFCISTSEMITGLDLLLSPLRRLGIKTMDLVMMIQVTLRFLPLLAISAERIAKAQASRGAQWGTGKSGLIAQIRKIVPLIVPLFVTSLRRAESMALAMDARAYGLKNQRTSIYELVFNPRDTWFLLIGLGFTLTTILL